MLPDNQGDKADVEDDEDWNVGKRVRVF